MADLEKGAVEHLIIPPILVSLHIPLFQAECMFVFLGTGKSQKWMVYSFMVSTRKQKIAKTL